MLKRFIPRNVLVLHAEDFPNVGTEPLQYSFSVHRGVVVQWDADHDTRVLDWLDTLSVAMLQNLAVVQEHNGGIVLRWKAYVPVEFAEGQAAQRSTDAADGPKGLSINSEDRDRALTIALAADEECMIAH